MDIEEFALGNSFVHNLDPRVKIVCAVIFSTVVAVNHWIPAAALAIVFQLLHRMLDQCKARVSRLAVVNTLSCSSGYFCLSFPVK
jgi:energy-coupling factor transporter transmembrane protein EcfT